MARLASLGYLHIAGAKCPSSLDHEEAAQCCGVGRVAGKAQSNKRWQLAYCHGCLLFTLSDLGEEAALGDAWRSAPTMKYSNKRESLWRCPKCGHRFVTRNIWHSCGHYRLVDHFRGKPTALRDTFDRYVAAARRYGPVTVYAQKTRIVMQGRVRFSNTVVRKNWLDATMWLKRRISHPLLVRIESFGDVGYGHHFRLRVPEDVDASLVKLLGEAYAIGQQAPLIGTVPNNSLDRRGRKRASHQTWCDEG